ncbi:MAG: hypothetical protein HUJ63_04780, partial [Enterococcus sp.]|nr:hypothetical protein [Enterococcus sp.]
MPWELKDINVLGYSSEWYTEPGYKTKVTDITEDMLKASEDSTLKLYVKTVEKDEQYTAELTGDFNDKGLIKVGTSEGTSVDFQIKAVSGPAQTIIVEPDDGFQLKSISWTDHLGVKHSVGATECPGNKYTIQQESYDTQKIFYGTTYSVELEEQTCTMTFKTNDQARGLITDYTKTTFGQKSYTVKRYSGEVINPDKFYNIAEIDPSLLSSNAQVISDNEIGVNANYGFNFVKWTYQYKGESIKESNIETFKNEEGQQVQRNNN